MSQDRDAVSLTREWRKRALRWFGAVPQAELEEHAKKPNGSLVAGGFVTFDGKSEQFFQYVDVSYTEKHTLCAKTFSATQGEVRSSGEGYELLQEFFDIKTDRALRAFGPVNAELSVSIDPR